MKNKVELKKYLFKVLFFSICLLALFLIINIYEYKVYTKNFNSKICSIVDTVQNKYPNINEKEIIEILNSEGINESHTLKKYGINLDDKSIVMENEKKYYEFLILNSLVLALGIIIITFLFLKFIKNRETDIKDITKYIEQLNKKNYSLKIDSNTEDELSILKNEIYKTTVMLKETADISKKDKLNLKISLEDISHQLKTPITSILVMLDNLIYEPDMDKKIREDFIIDIKRNITNINFLVQSILKLSKFDANTINFVLEERLIKDIIEEAVLNVSILCDLKNIKINVKGDSKITINCDFMWQVEAITNIVKNSVEHSNENSEIDISYEKNTAYVIVKIKDYGEGIDEKELSHIFERFYKGKNSSPDSIGIGLALAKTIIEKSNGIISVTSDKTGTEFVIKYLHMAAHRGRKRCAKVKISD